MRKPILLSVIAVGLVCFVLVLFPTVGAWSNCSGNAFSQLSTDTVTANGQYGFAGAWFCVDVPTPYHVLTTTVTDTSTITIVQSSTVTQTSSTIQTVTTAPHIGSIEIEVFGTAPSSATFTYTGPGFSTVRAAILNSGTGFFTATDEGVPAGNTSATLTYGSASHTVSFGPTAFQSFSWGYAWEA